MNLGELLASAGINISLALVMLLLFSVLKKQPGNAPVYLARPLAAGRDLGLDRRFSVRRLCPSLSWMPEAFWVSEEEILRRCGLDALVVIRLFKLGIKFSTAYSIIGVFILIPVNYSCQQSQPPIRVSHSMNSLTISNVGRASDRLWVHFVCLCLISFYTLYMLFKEYKGITDQRIQQIHNNRQRPDQFTVLVRGIPYCFEHKSRGCCTDHFFSRHHPNIYHSYQMVYNGKAIEELLHLASSIERKITQIHQQTGNKPNKGSVFCGIFTTNNADRNFHEERLQDVHWKIGILQSETILKQKELSAAFVSFKSRRGAALVAQTQQHVDPLIWMTELAPEPRDVIWRNLDAPYCIQTFHRIGVFVATSLLTVFFAIPVTAVQGIVRFEKINKWFPPARAVQLIPGLKSILTGYLPSAILNGFIYVVPFAMLEMASFEGCVSKSKKEIKACSMFFYFLVGNVFFLSLLSGSLLEQIGKSFTHPKDFPGRLASAVSTQSDFFITYILTNGLSGFSLEVVQLGLFSWHLLRSKIFRQSTQRDSYLFGFPYYRVVPIVSLAILLGMVYAVVAPLLLPFLIVYFLLGYAVYVNQMEDVYEIKYETYGEYWPYIHHYLIIAIILMQITMIGIFILKSKPGPAISTIVLLLVTVLFNEYCKIQFLPTFHNFPIQVAKENDERDEMEGVMEANQVAAINAYRPPWMRPVYIDQESSSMQPLVSSSEA